MQTPGWHKAGLTSSSAISSRRWARRSARRPSRTGCSPSRAGRRSRPGRLTPTSWLRDMQELIAAHASGRASAVEAWLGRRAVAHGLVDPQPAGKRAAQPLHQCARRHAGRRAADDRDREQAGSTGGGATSVICQPGQYVSICVSDTGAGMEPEVIDTAFDPFFTTKPIGKGTGLGLSMVYGFARQSGGQVQIVSEAGEGTTSLPLSAEARGGADIRDRRRTGSRRPRRAGSGETVLVVDDEPTVRHARDRRPGGARLHAATAADDSAAGLRPAPVRCADRPADHRRRACPAA